MRKWRCSSLTRIFPEYFPAASVALPYGSSTAHCCWTQIQNAAYSHSCAAASYSPLLACISLSALSLLLQTCPNTLKSLASFPGATPCPNHRSVSNMCEHLGHTQFPDVCCMFEQANVDNILIWFSAYCPEFICEKGHSDLRKRSTPPDSMMLPRQAQWNLGVTQTWQTKEEEGRRRKSCS